MPDVRLRVTSRCGFVAIAMVCGFTAIGATGPGCKLVQRTPREPPTATMTLGGAPTDLASVVAGQLDAVRIPVGNSPMRGEPSALVTIVEFGDYQCPFCARAEVTLRALQHRYGRDLRIVFKQNPLPFHAYAALAAEAALAAGAQGRYWEMHDLLYANPTALTQPDLERYASQIGLNMIRFRRDLTSHTFASRIADDQALAARVSANGTPNFFINGRQLSGAQPLSEFTTAVDAALERARSIFPRNSAYQRMVDDPRYAATPPTPPAPPAPIPTPYRPAPTPSTVFNVPVGLRPVRGRDDALVTVVVFSDFQCPFCRRVEPTLAQLSREYGADLRVVWRNEPLAFHPDAQPAAEAAMEMYAQQGAPGFWRYHDTLFASAPALSVPDLERYAAAQGADMPAFRAAMASHRHSGEVAADQALATSVGASGTPTFFINGRSLVGAQPIEQFRTAIDAARTEALARVATGVARRSVYAALTASGATSAP